MFYRVHNNPTATSNASRLLHLAVPHTIVVSYTSRIVSSNNCLFDDYYSQSSCSCSSTVVHMSYT